MDMPKRNSLCVQLCMFVCTTLCMSYDFVCGILMYQVGLLLCIGPLSRSAQTLLRK